MDITSLLHRFFEEEGFSNTREAIAANIEVMRHNENCWIAAAMHDGQIVGAVTVTSMLYVEWGRLGEIGDIYILPPLRGKGIARRLIEKSIEWCRSKGCSDVEVIMTPEGEAMHGLSKFYEQTNHRNRNGDGRDFVQLYLSAVRKEEHVTSRNGICCGVSDNVSRHAGIPRRRANSMRDELQCEDEKTPAA